MDESVRGQGLPSPQEVCLSSYVILIYTFHCCLQVLEMPLNILELMPETFVM